MVALTRGSARIGPVDTSVASRARTGRQVCGDRACTRPWAGGALVAAVDGLGSGEAAALASRRACETLETASAGESPSVLLERCHQALRHTRGAALSLAVFSGSGPTMAWLGVGNVEGVLLRAHPAGARETLVPRPGIVGHRLPRLRCATVALQPGDTLVLATDGIERGFASALAEAAPAASLARRLLERFSHGEDDALVLVARYLGHKQ